MKERNQKQRRHIRAARQWLGEAEHSLAENHRVRGELKVIAINTDADEPIAIARGERVAQLVVQRVPAVELVEVDELDATERGEAGFGSTGLR